MEKTWYETGRLLGAEKQYHCSALPLLRQKPFYERSAYTIEDHSVCNLMSKYQKLSMALESMRHSTRLPIQPYITIPIPPVPLLVLQRSQHTGDLVKSALETREKFAHLRDSLRVLREEFAEPSMSPQKKMRALNSWKKSWRTLDKYHEQSSFIDIATASNKGISQIDAKS